MEWGDATGTWRLIRLVDDLSAQPTGSIPLASGAGRRPKKPTGCWTTTHWTGGRFWRSIPSEQWSGWGVIGSSCVPGHAPSWTLPPQPGMVGVGATGYEAQHGLYVHPTWR
ncbi:MAG: hypothetical protein IPL59_05890 [Candidatus Competibacteraceae bacterium]|nr:hypothetical protein [Candidatus Competibacteraceae bacterium]